MAVAFLQCWYRRLLSVWLVLSVTWLVLWKTVGDRNGLLYLLNSLAFWILSGAWLGSWLRFGFKAPWWALLLSESLGLIWLRHYAWMFVRRLPRAPSDMEPAPELQILSANLLKKIQTVQPLIQYIEGHPADVVLFQEVTHHSVVELDNRLQGLYPYRYWIADPSSQLGLGVFSRLPLMLEERWSTGLAGPYALRLRICVAGQSLVLYNIHLLSPLFDRYGVSGNELLVMRNRQVQDILADAREQEHPVLLMGDWNTTEASDIYQAVRSEFRDCWAEAGKGPGWTWPHNLEPHSRLGARPVLRLEHAFCSADLEITEAQVITQPMGSDHSPVVYTFRLSDPVDLDGRD